jgi:hypothetical protein
LLACWLAGLLICWLAGVLAGSVAAGIPLLSFPCQQATVHWLTAEMGCFLYQKLSF